ncbi:hypothetical protein CCUS01_01143 [Colletotrichum cuscutae]|uniref:Uncharacterized protein n=1 Tax=Colletotrichum cuscutae TaxID=1209917 RepID=A0AAI9UWZ3_9PEZI|nr:hypothetical protein CCUS01_01143 [Colletotrichum cuscutae]
MFLEIEKEKQEKEGHQIPFNALYFCAEEISSIDLVVSSVGSPSPNTSLTTWHEPKSCGQAVEDSRSLQICWLLRHIMNLQLSEDNIRETSRRGTLTSSCDETNDFEPEDEAWKCKVEYFIPRNVMKKPLMFRERERQADPDCLVLSPRHADDKLLNAKSKLPIDIQTKMIHDRAPASEVPGTKNRASCMQSGESSALSIQRRRSSLDDGLGGSLATLTLAFCGFLFPRAKRFALECTAPIIDPQSVGSVTPSWGDGGGSFVSVPWLDQYVEMSLVSLHRLSIYWVRTCTLHLVVAHYKLGEPLDARASRSSPKPYGALDPRLLRS